MAKTNTTAVPATAAAAKAPAAAGPEVKLVTGRVLAGIEVSGQRFNAGDIIEDVPEALVAGIVDADEEVVALARSQGFPVKKFREQ